MSMAERADRLGWHLRVESRPGEGTQICVTERAMVGAS